MIEKIMEYIYIIPISMISIIVHELTHAIVSYLLGDPTPKEDGRISLNPLKHIDFVGLVCLAVVHVGWAKPVKINSQYYKNERLGTLLVALAGPISNFILAIIAGLLYVLSFKINSTVLYYIGIYMLVINVGLGIFNLIPIPPLDGSYIISCFLPTEARAQFEKYRTYGFYIIIGLVIFLNVWEKIYGVDILNDVIMWVSNRIIDIWSFVY